VLTVLQSALAQQLCLEPLDHLLAMIDFVVLHIKPILNRLKIVISLYIVCLLLLDHHIASKFSLGLGHAVGATDRTRAVW